MKYTHLLLFASLSALLHSCISARKTARYFRQKEAQESIQLNDVKVTPQRKDDFRTVPARHIDILHMNLNVQFNWAKHECMGKEELLITPYFYETDSIILDAKNMVFDGITLTDQQGNNILYLTQYDKKMLRIRLEKKLRIGDTVKLAISYIARPDEKEKGGSQAIKDDKGLYFINTDGREPFKPSQIWTQGETEANSCWFPTIDKPNEKFTSTLSITVNKNLVTLSNGQLIRSEEQENTRTDTWHNALPMPAYLTMMAIGDFTVTRDEWRQREVSYYLEPDYKPYAREIFKNTVEMLEFYSRQLGVEYPWNKYAQVVVRDYVSGAMENTSATLHGESVQKNSRELVDADNDGIISHELFHQWFGDLVTCKSWSHLVINEGFASYGEQLWIEHKEGKDAALRKSYNTIQRYLQYAKNTADGPIVNFNYRDKEDMFNTLTYQKGSRVLHLLRSITGDEAFFLAIRNFLKEHAFGNADIDDLRREIEKVTGQDYRPFFQQWFLRGGHPSIDVHYDYIDSAGLLAVTVEQIQNAETGLLQFPLTFKVTQGKLQKNHTFPIARKKEIFYVQKLDEGQPERVDVIVDPESTFLGEIKDNKPFFNHILTYNRAGSYIEKVRSLKELSTLQQYDTVRFTLLSAINDADADIRLKSLGWIDWKNPDNLTKTKEFLIHLAKEDPSPAVRAKVTQLLGTGKNQELLSLFNDLLRDSSYTVAGEALLALHQLLPEEALRQCPQLEKDARGKLFSAISEVYAKTGTIADTTFFHHQHQRVFHAKRAALMSDRTALLLRVGDFEQVMKHTRWLGERALDEPSVAPKIAAFRLLKSIQNKFDTLVQQTKDDSLKSQFKQAATDLSGQFDSLIAQTRDEQVLSQLKMMGLLTAKKENAE